MEQMNEFGFQLSICINLHILWNFRTLIESEFGILARKSKDIILSNSMCDFFYIYIYICEC